MTDTNSVGDSAGAKSFASSISITVTEFPNSPPVFGGTLADIDVDNEGSSSVVCPSATDPDSGDILSYSVFV